MKIAPINILLPFILLSAASVPAASGPVLDFFDSLVLDIFGDAPEDEADSSSSSTGNNNKAAEYVELNLRENPILGPVMDRLGEYATGQAVTEIAQGKRAYECMNEINAADTNSRSGPARKKFQFADEVMRAISYGVAFQIFDSNEDIDVICPSEDDVRRMAVLEGGSSQNNLRRRTQEQTVGAEPAYPYLDPEDIKMTRNKHVAAYLEGGDLNNRASIGELVTQLNSQIAVYRTTSENLELAGAWVTTLGDFLSTVQPEAGIVVAGAQLDIGSFIRGLSGFLTNLSITLDQNVSRRQRTLAMLSNHKSLIDSAEIEAGLKNTQSLMIEIMALKQQVATLQARV